ncbi:hypothetical protein HHI36_000497 [Cryptolaemus montrouzieri]|uniref:Uncharacterized protein n=1 Tax=Cryptolaemus montrouzieri TaxID=559131 RepID=A0ABD2P5J5_9CUCU
MTTLRDNSENIIREKKQESILQKFPIRRPALGDLSNKVASHVTHNVDDKKLTFKKPLKEEVQPTKVTKNDAAASRTEKIIAKVESRQLPQKTLKRNESILHSLTSRSKTPEIYNPDENTKNDPNAVTEYLEDIFCYMRGLEVEHSVRIDYLKGHRTTPTMRSVVVDWLVEVQISFKLCLDTLHLSISILDRYLETNINVGRETLQLVAISGLMIAAKYEEVMIPEVVDFVYVCDDTFTKHQILEMERNIFAALKFFIPSPSSIQFLRRYSKIARVTPLQHNLGKYLLELAILDYNTCQILPSHLAAAACCLSIGILNEQMNLSEVWSPTMQHYTTLKLSDFKHVMALLAQLLIKIETSKYQTIRKKYANSSHGKISANRKLKGPLVMKLISEYKPKK